MEGMELGLEHAKRVAEPVIVEEYSFVSQSNETANTEPATSTLRSSNSRTNRSFGTLSQDNLTIPWYTANGGDEFWNALPEADQLRSVGTWLEDDAGRHGPDAAMLEHLLRFRADVDAARNTIGSVICHVYPRETRRPNKVVRFDAVVIIEDSLKQDRMSYDRHITSDTLPLDQPLSNRARDAAYRSCDRAQMLSCRSSSTTLSDVHDDDSYVTSEVDRAQHGDDRCSYDDTSEAKGWVDAIWRFNPCCC